MIPLPSHPGLSQGIRNLKGVGQQIEKALCERGLRTVGDLVTLMPSRYQDRRRLVPLNELVPESEVLTGGVIQDTRQGVVPKTYRRYFEIILYDEDAQVSAIWFRLPAHLRETTSKGRRVILFGRVQSYRHRLSIVHPELVPWPDGYLPEAEVRPVYPEIEDVKPGALRRIMAEVNRQLASLPAIFPHAWLAEKKLSDPVECLRILHQPPADRPGPLPKPQDSRAWANMALFELLFLQLALARSRARQAVREGLAFPERSVLAEAFLAGLPFELTEGQRSALGEIGRDMAAAKPMSRLLQGDVGSGKTVVALAAAMTAVDGGRQAAIMAPTEILARQHFETLLPHARRLGVEADLLVGGLPEAEKAARRSALASGRTRIVVGTHALISESVEYESLGLAVIDEQHRFGVGQRLALRAKAAQADMLVMTATPIPRTLALTIYGDLDISTIAGMPPGRKPVRTEVFGPEERAAAYGLLAAEVAAGGQAYVVAPRIESRDEPVDGNGDDLASAMDLLDYVRREGAPGAPAALVHGRMKPDERQTVMDDFRRGDIRILVATTVIEVGVDVPGASVMLVEGADHFGLAQLHQLRGRVGRGERPSLCLLVAGTDEAESSSRLRVMAGTSDGFELAEEDLKLRGPGDAAGLRQSGLPGLTWARLPRDLEMLLKARELAREIIDNDQELAEPSFKLVREVVDELDRRIQAELAEAG